MKILRFLLPALPLAAVLAGCKIMDVDQQVASSPREYWQPVASALPAQPLTFAPIAGNVTGAELSLPTLVDLALSNNPQTRAAWHDAKSAAAQLGETNSAYYPTVDGNFALDRNKIRTVGVNGSTFAGTTYSTTYGPSLGINYVLWNFGKREAQTEASREALYAANFLYNQQIQDVILATELAYFNFDAAEGFVAAAQAILDDANASFKAADQRLSAGLGTRQEDLQASAQVSNAEYQLEVAQSQVETARAQLALSLGIPVTDKLNIERNQKLESSAKIDDDISQLMALAMRQRPDLLAAYATVLEGQHNVEAAKADEKPVISAISNLSYGYVSAGVTHGNPQNNYMVGLQVSWQIFTGFEKTYAILDAQEREDAAREILHSQELKVVTDVWNFFYSYKNALRQVDSTNAQVAAQQEAFNAINTGYKAGLNTYVDLQTALSSLATALQQQVQAEATLGASIANLAHATGNMPVKSKGE